MTRPAAALATAAVAVLLAPAGAAAQYHGPHTPGGQAERPSHARTLKVCKKKAARRCFRSIQRAVSRARRGDTIRIADGTYRGGVRIAGAKRSHLRVIGNRSHPRRVRVVLRGGRARTAVVVDGARSVTVAGVSARGYRDSGFVARGATDFDFDRVVAMGPRGRHGIKVLGSRGGEITRADTFYNGGAGVYVGRTPRQRKPRRTMVRRLRAWGNAAGFAGTGMRYVTLTRSELFNNGVGIAPRAGRLVIANNDVFWNNFDHYRGAPFGSRKVGGLHLPPGIGVLLPGTHGTRLHGNRIFGNHLAGAALLYGVPRDTAVTANDFGRGGADLNGRDLAYDGAGGGNCFEDNLLRSPTVPADGDSFAACPGPDPNRTDTSAREEGLRWLEDPTHEQHWVRHPHARYRGYAPLEHWNSDYEPGGDL